MIRVHSFSFSAYLRALDLCSARFCADVKRFLKTEKFPRSRYWDSATARSRTWINFTFNGLPKFLNDKFCLTSNLCAKFLLRTHRLLHRYCLSNDHCKSFSSHSRNEYLARPSNVGGIFARIFKPFTHFEYHFVGESRDELYFLTTPTTKVFWALSICLNPIRISQNEKSWK